MLLEEMYEFLDDRSKPIDSVRAITFSIVDKLTQRSGFENVWDECDDLTKEEILNEIADTVQENINSGSPE